MANEAPATTGEPMSLEGRVAEDDQGLLVTVVTAGRDMTLDLDLQRAFVEAAQGSDLPWSLRTSTRSVSGAKDGELIPH